jgi:8-oxo-dGTP diphosphatase
VSYARRLLPDAARILREAARHLLRRPVVGVAVAAQGPGERWLLIRRRDTGGWALPGGTLEWGETLTDGAKRELLEEAGVVHEGSFDLCGVYSSPVRDYRFHAVTILLRAQVSEPQRPPMNALEIADVRLFSSAELPSSLSLNMTDMLADARAGRRVLE